MLRNILAPPKKVPNHPLPQSPRAAKNHPSPTAFRVSEPSDFRLIAHVECDPNIGLYKGIDECMTRVVIPHGRRSPDKSGSSPPPVLLLLPLRSLAEHLAYQPSCASSPNLTPNPLPSRGPRPASHSPRQSPRRQQQPMHVLANKPPLANLRRSPGVAKTQVSRPSRMRHEVHACVGLDNPTGLAALPRAWKTIRMYSGILPGVAAAHPEAVIDVLNFSKTSDPTIGGRQDRRDSLSRALFPIFLEKMQMPSLTSFDDGTDENFSRSDSYLFDTPVTLKTV